MAKIEIIQDTAGITEPTILVYSGSLYEFLSTHYKNGFSTPTSLFLNGAELDLANIDYDVTLKRGDHLRIVSNPAGVLGVITAIASAISLGATVYSLTQTPKIEEPTDYPRQSPNNSLRPQGNMIRLGDRIPEIFGRNRIRPDLLSAGYEYQNNKTVVTELMCVGEGSYYLSDWRDNETPITGDQDYIITQYGPNERPNEVVRYLRSEITGDAEIYPANGNQATIPPSKVRIEFDEVTGQGYLISTDPAFSWLDLLDANAETVTLVQCTAWPVNIPPQFPEGATYPESYLNISGTYDLTSVTSDTLILADVRKIVTVSWRIFTGGGGGSGSAVVQTTGELWGYLEDSFITNNGGNVAKVADAIQDGLSKPRTMPYKQTAIWINCKSANVGFKGDVEVSVNFPNTALPSQVFKFVSDSDVPQYRTFKVVLPEYDQYTISITRDDEPSEADKPYQRIIIDSIFAVTDYPAFDVGNNVPVIPNFGDVTTVLVKTTSSESTRNRPDKNCIAHRILRGYDRDTGQFTTPVPTSRLADAMLQKLTSFYGANKPVSDIDLDGLYEIDERLPEQGKFCYTFSDPDSPVGAEIRAIQNAARIATLRTGSKIHFTRDEVRPFHSMLLSRSIKAKGFEEKRDIKMWRSGDFNAIRVVWMDEENNIESTIDIPDDGGDYNRREIDAVGIKNRIQAQALAEYEYNRLIKQNEKVTARVTKHGLIATIGDKVLNVDGNELGAIGGEVLGKDGLTLTLSERYPEPFAGEIYFTLEDGEVSDPVQCSITANKCILSVDVIGIYLAGDADSFTGDEYTIGSLYGIVKSGDQLKRRFYTVTNTSRTDGVYVDLEMVNYDESIFPADS